MTQHVQDNINAYWTDRAPAYDDYQQRPERRLRDREAWARIWREALPAAPARVLDVGTGSGHVAMVLASMGFDVTATDLSPGMLERAREHAAGVDRPPVFLLGDAVDPDFDDGSFDALTSRYLMWTLRQPDVALANWRRILRPGGTIALVDSVWFPDGLDAESATDAAPDFLDLYDDNVRTCLPLASARSIEETRDLVAAAGFGDVTLTPLTSIHALDEEFGVAPNHRVQMQYLIRATA